ncbi:BTAD domain-containing putative transcriptional regulator [Phycicoccus sp. Soil748]|uniref:BTAD domain-containing putative transcriptional regulator n=1 Tax=Phycicoccus sp. Soil748 TaxID=1736397 RepID=UPI00138F9A10|nr:BTAD domain-containing putative transcriptional regulator [Phycicoccus sp. Soil748]
MRVGVLGTAEAQLDGVPVDLGTRKQRALVAALAMNRGRPVSVDALVDLLWPVGAPPGVTGTLQAYVAGLRRALEPDRAARAPSTVLVTVTPGYALRLGEDDVDAHRFDRAVSRAHRRLGHADRVQDSRGLTASELAEITAELDAALAQWRGEPYADLEDAPSAVAERARLQELRLVALEDRAVAALELGHHGTVAGELEALTTAHPLRERLWALRALALTRAGRQADALEALRQLREVLADELGLEPSADLRELQGAVLRQDPSLEWRAPGGATAAAPAPSPPAPGLATGRSSARSSVRLGQIESVVPSLPPWPMVGRESQLGAVLEQLDQAETGSPAFVALVGEPGIGKSRLAAELATRAGERGAAVLLGRCSQDDGAPPLWPWLQVLRGLGRDLPELPDDGSAPFGVWEQIVADVVEAARGPAVVVVLDDLHWADVASLRVLRLLVESATDARLLVLSTWRNRPEPTGALADVAEALARRHALRVDLHGLAPHEVGRVVEAVAGSEPTATQAVELAHRTDGNPFFLVEYARLARDGGGLTVLEGEAHPPAAVHDVLVRRLQRLPEESLTALRWAAVLGRQFDLPTLAEVSGSPEEELLDRLDPALDAGLLREDGIELYLFGHALVRDTIYGSLSATRRARAHARVAAALQGRPGRETELARHWLAAGPSYAARGWLAAVSAAVVARRLHAYDEATDLLVSALDTHPLDPDGTPRERFDLLCDLADARRWAGDWAGLVEAVEEAIGVADEIGDVELVGRAATMTAVGALWQSGPHGTVNEVVVSALRRVLAALPEQDSPLRCRVMLSLALETYYGSGYDERTALVEEGLAMADRVGDPALLLDGYQLAFVALWCPRTAPQRLRYVSEAMLLAHQLGDDRAYVVTTTLRAVVSGELGLPAEMWEHAAVARDAAERQRLPYGIIVLDSLELPWLAMAGHFEECEERLANIRLLDQRMSLHQTDDATLGAMMALRVWQGRASEMADGLMAAEAQSPLPLAAVVAMFLLRSGRRDLAEEYVAGHPLDLGHDDWFAMLTWCSAAEVALGRDDRELGVRAYELLAPYEGFSCCAGSGVALGPVDAFLALAAAAGGEKDVAARHAERALELCENWQVPLAAQWLRDQRDLFGF